MFQSDICSNGFSLKVRSMSYLDWQFKFHFEVNFSRQLDDVSNTNDLESKRTTLIVFLGTPRETISVSPK